MALVTLSVFSKLLTLIRQRSKFFQSWGNSTDLLLLFGLSYHLFQYAFLIMFSKMLKYANCKIGFT